MKMTRELEIVVLVLAFVFCGGQAASAGEIAAWGENTASQASPPAGSQYVAISAGQAHGLALKVDGSIVGWGYDFYGEADPCEGNDFVAISASYFHSLALRADGSLAAWGITDGSENDHGQVTDTPNGTDYVAIAAGQAHSLALKADGSVTGWGFNSAGQATPPAGNDFEAIAAGGYHSLALKSDGSIAAWGSDFYDQASPPAANDFVAIAAGYYHSLALKTDGSIVAWGVSDGGAEDYGQVTDTPGGNDFVAVAAGHHHNTALKADGTLVGWGRDDFNEASPPAGTGFTAIAAGNGFNLALSKTPMGTGFTYQGRLMDADNAADGLYDFRFELYNDMTSGMREANSVYRDEVDVLDGYFTVLLDFGSEPNIFNGEARWLEIAVRPGEWEDPNIYTTLAPRQRITPTPYALYAANAAGAADSDWTIEGSSMYAIPDCNVGIGTTDILYKLEVGSYDEAINYVRVNSSDWGGVLFYDGDPIYTTNAAVQYYHSQDFMRFCTEPPDGNYPYEKMRITSVGNVGIGTGSPSDKLTVEGTIKGTISTRWEPAVYGKNYYSGNGYYPPDSPTCGGRFETVSGVGAFGFATGNAAMGLYGKSTGSNGYGVHGYASASSGTNYGIYGETGSSEGYAGYFLGGRNYFEGNVGIGTDEPGAKLEVAGQVKITGGSPAVGKVLTSDADGLASWEPATGGDSDWAIHVDDMYAIPVGNVGIGTPSPDTKLTVESTAQGIKSTTSLDTGRAVHGIATNTGNYNNYGGYFEAAGDRGQAVYANASGNRGYGLYAVADGTAATGVGGTAGATGDVANFGGYFTAAGDRGIGVVGRGTGGSGTGVHGYAVAFAGTNYGVFGQTNSSDGYAGYFLGGTNYFEGSVGIGNDSPSAKLDVNGPVRIDGPLEVGEQYTAYDVNMWGNLTGGRLFWDQSKMALRAGREIGAQWSDANVGFYSLGVGSNVAVAGWHSLGVGEQVDVNGSHCTALGQYLDVEGNYAAAVGRYLRVNAEHAMVLGRGLLPNSRLTNDTADSLMVGFNSDMPTVFVGPSSGAGTTGDVGIGTVAPEAKLDVRGTIEVDQKIQAHDAGGLELATADGTTRLYIEDTGEVGIGTSTPDRELEVVGTILATNADANGRAFQANTGGTDATSVMGYSLGPDGKGVHGVAQGSGGIGVCGTALAGADKAGYFGGDLHVTGDITKAYSVGTENSAVPIAYGFINSDGSVANATPNVSSTWNAGSSRYEITITDVSYISKFYATTVTVSSSTPYVATTDDVSGKLLVYVNTLGASPTQAAFQFVTYKP